MSIWTRRSLIKEHVMKKKAETKKKSPAKPAASVPPALAMTTSEAQRYAARILEVLGGQCSPPQAAQALAISLPRYYQLEARALEGLVAALAPRPTGKQPLLENRIKSLEKQLEAAQRQCARQEALVRVTQRTLGLATPAASKSSTPSRDTAGRRQRRPMVRALKAARVLETKSQAVDADPSVKNAGQTEANSVQPAAPAGAEEVRPCSA
jgi:hypothetical protein